MVAGYDFMPYGWCGGCETCDMMPCPEVCLACSYSRKWYPKDWPITFCEKTFSPQEKVSKFARSFITVESRIHEKPIMSKHDYDGIIGFSQN